MLRTLSLLLLLAPSAWAGRRDDTPNVALAPPVEEGDFRFGAGDRLGITVWKHPELDAELTVAPDGTATFPLVGRVRVEGRSYEELVQVLEEGFRRYYSDATVAVNVAEVNNRKVFVVGEVTNPAVLQITGEMRLLEALVRSGGIHPNARTDNVLLVRGGLEQAQLYTVDVDRLLGGDTSQNPELRAGDIVVVPARTIVNAERFFRHVQGILSPFVAASQVYRNTVLPGGTQIVDDAQGE